MTDITRRGHARTNYDPEEFIEAFEDADLDRQAEIREALRRLDGGRFYDFLDEAHNVLSRSDLKRRREFRHNYSDHLIRWIKAFGVVEELDTFPEIEV